MKKYKPTYKDLLTCLEVATVHLDPRSEKYLAIRKVCIEVIAKARRKGQ